MRAWKKGAAVALAIGVGGAATAAWAQANPGGSSAAPGRPMAARGGRDLGGGTTQETYVGITPCRLADTRSAGGQVAPGTPRDFRVRGLGPQFASQGGNPSGCGIPLAADSIAGTISAVGATGTGYLRASPASAGTPTTTFLNYVAAFSVTNSGVLTLGTGESSLAVTTFQHPTYVVIDVSGYFIKPLAAVVRADGTLARGSRVLATAKVHPGGYSVQFDRDITGCAFTADAGETALTGGVIGVATTGLVADTTDSVFVVTTNSGGTFADLPFHLLVTC